MMSDQVAIAFQADLTRVVTLMYSREGGNRTYRSIGVPDAHHGLSHHQNDPARMARLQMIDQHHVAGGASGALRGGRHLRYPAGTPMMNLFLTLLDRLGADREQIGDSTGPIEHVSDL